MKSELSFNKKYDATSAAVKWVAAITMLIDHIGAVILEWIYKYGDKALYDIDRVVMIDKVFRAIGRASFPLFIFLLVEGFFYTKNRSNYMTRLLVFMVISEVPFDLAFSAIAGSRQLYFYTGYQNVLFTLSIGFGAMWILEAIFKTAMSYTQRVILMVFTVMGALGVAHILQTDYGAWGVLAVIASYMMKKRGASPFMNGLAIIVILTMMKDTEAFAAIIDLPLLAFYHGKKGYSHGKYFFYFFYPAHLLVLYIMRVILISE